MKGDLGWAWLNDERDDDDEGWIMMIEWKWWLNDKDDDNWVMVIEWCDCD